MARDCCCCETKGGEDDGVGCVCKGVGGGSAAGGDRGARHGRMYGRGRSIEIEREGRAGKSTESGWQRHCLEEK